MTLNRAANTLTAVLTVLATVGFVTTGSLMMGLLVLAAPWPSMWVQTSDRQTWSLGEVLRGKRDEEHPVASALHDALRGPLPTPSARDDDYFVPGVPRLDAGRFGTDEPGDLRLATPRLDPSLLDRPLDAPIAQHERSAPVSTPLR